VITALVESNKLLDPSSPISIEMGDRVSVFNYTAVTATWANSTFYPLLDGK